jgi:hypothetical protein
LLCVAAIVLAVATFYNNNRFLLNNLYLDDLVKSPGIKASNEYHWAHRFGSIGDLTAVDLKLIFRNKRPRSVLLVSCIFLFYGLILYKPRHFEDDEFGILVFAAILITGTFMANYGQSLFAWQSNHFDGLMAANLSLKKYLKSKFTLLTGFCTAAFLLSLFYGFINWKIIPIHIGAYFFNIGVNSVIAVYVGTYTYKAVDLSKGTSFNYQGTDVAQLLYTLLIVFIGFIAYLPFAIIFNSWAGVLAIGVLGLISFLQQDWWIDKLSKQFQKRKHKILEGFREK